MCLRYLLVALLTLTTANSAHAIVNGTEVSDQRFLSDFPWAVTVVNSLNDGICGGVLVAPRWVLTAGHCSWGMRHVLVGHAQRSQARRVEVEQAYRHPNFSYDTLQYDAALLLLQEEVELPPAPLASATEVRLLLRAGVTGRILGWGVTEDSATPVDRLREAAIRLNGYARAGTRYAYDFSAAPCGRDSGSPMLLQTIDGRWLVVGIANATSGNLCANGGGVAIYTSLAPLSAFVRDKLANPDTR